jgi:hypothetical protein
MRHGAPSAFHRLGREIGLAYTHITIARHHLTALPIHGFIARLYGCQAVQIAVVHAQGRCDHNGVMDLDICCAQAARVRHIFCCNVLASALHFACDDKQGFQLCRYRSVLKVSLTRRTSSSSPSRCAAAMAPWIDWQ